MERKDYEKPTMTVGELQHRMMILAGSGGFRGRDPYDPTDDNPFG